MTFLLFSRIFGFLLKTSIFRKALDRKMPSDQTTKIHSLIEMDTWLCQCKLSKGPHKGLSLKGCSDCSGSL